MDLTAGVFGISDAPGPGVLGQGGAAFNPFGVLAPPVTATNGGTGVIGIGGAPAAASTATGYPSTTPIEFPALPGGPGVVGVAGGAAVPALGTISSAGVVGIGTPAQPTFDPALAAGPGVVGLAGGVPPPAAGFPAAGIVGMGLGSPGSRGGVFGSVGNIAQIQLQPPEVLVSLPESGLFGDLYFTLYLAPVPGNVTTVLKAVMYLCVQPGFPPVSKAQWAPFVMGPVREGGELPVGPPTVA